MLSQCAAEIPDTLEDLEQKKEQVLIDQMRIAIKEHTVTVDVHSESGISKIEGIWTGK